MTTKAFDTYEAAAAYARKTGGVVWKHDAGYYTVTSSHAAADEIPGVEDEWEKWIEIE